MNLTIFTAATGPRDVEAEEVAPGLYLHRQPDDVDLGDPRRWRVSHHSGYAIAAAMGRADAIAGARRASELADWTVSRTEILSQVDGAQLYIALGELGCGHPEVAPRTEHRPGVVSVRSYCCETCDAA